MRGHRSGLAVLVTVLGLLVTGALPARAATRAAAPERPRPGTLSLESDHLVGDTGRLHALTLHSAALGTDTAVRVMLPKGYDDPGNADVRYPVLFLLHGASGNERSWSDHFDFAGDTDADGLIVVMPDGGREGFYSDWNDGPAWETYHVGELLPWVDRTFRTYGDRAHRGIAGLSMGGYGALEYASRHPDRFVAAASFSGATDITYGGVFADAILSAANVADDRRWGTYEGDTVTWEDHNPADRIGNLGPVRVALYTGNGVPSLGDNVAAGTIELGAFYMNTSYHKRAAAQGVDVDYHAYGQGTHEWSYWVDDLTQWLPTLRATIADPPPVPDHFDYESAEPEFSVWGWTVAVQRDTKQALSLTHVSDHGLDADGVGRVTFTTAADFEPGATYTVSGGDGVTAFGDDEGRLHFTISMTGLTHIGIDHVAAPAARGR